MRELDLELAAQAGKMEDEYKALFKIWEEAKDRAKNDDEYLKTRPLFDNALAAMNKWKEFYFKHGKNLRFERLN